MLGQNRLRVKLNSKDRMLGVLDRHDRSVVGPGRRPQDRRQTRRIDRQGMVPADLKFLRQSLEQSIARMLNPSRLAMHGLGSSNDPATQGLTDSLMP